MKRSILFLSLILLCLPAYAITFRQNPDGTVSLAWDANSEPDLSGYKVYWGSASGTYGTPVTLGKVTTFTTPKLANGTWFFAVTAHNTGGLESGFSNEVSCVVAVAPTPPANLRIVSEPQALMVARKTAVVSWKTNIAAFSQISYNRLGFAPTVIKATDAATDHTFRLEGLQPNQRWDYTVTSELAGETVTASGSFVSR